MPYTLTNAEKETTILYNQTSEPVCISTYDPTICRRLAKFAQQHLDLRKRIDKQLYPDYAAYEVEKGRISIRLVPPFSDARKQAASERAKQQCLGTKQEKMNSISSQSRGHQP